LRLLLHLSPALGTCAARLSYADLTKTTNSFQFTETLKVKPNFAVWRAKQVAFASHLSPSMSQQKKFWRKTYL